MENFRNKYHDTVFKQLAAIKTAVAAQNYALANKLEYQIDGDKRTFVVLINYLKSQAFCNQLKNQSNSAGKRMLKSMYHLWKKPSLRKINIFCHWLNKNFIGMPKVKLTKSSKEREIDAKRLVMRKAQIEYHKAFEAFKAEKGIYYRVTKVNSEAFSDFEQLNITENA